MNGAARKYYIWVISLIVVLVCYQVYTWISGIPKIDFDAAEYKDTAADSNVGGIGGEVGKIGQVGVGSVQKARYVHMNEKKQIDRVFGFEKLLYEAGSEWEIEKPFMDIFQNKFKCKLTADHGRVRIENIVGKPAPKDATFSGNVVVHIIPEPGSNVQESYIYLDDMAFASDRSSFSTDGAVKFSSEDIQMLGKGLEIIYNEVLGKIEFLRVIQLDNLKIKTRSKLSPMASSADMAGLRAVKPPTAGRRNLSWGCSAAIAAETQDQSRKIGDEYRCIFSGDVVIDSPEHMVFADELTISRVLLSKISGDDDGKKDRENTASAAAAQVKEQAPAAVKYEDVQTVSGDGSGAAGQAGKAAVAAEPKGPEEKNSTSAKDGSYEAVLTCSNGIFLIPADSAKQPSDFTEADAAAGRESKSIADAGDRITFVAQKIDYDAISKDVIATGLSEITFYANDLIEDKVKKAGVPVKITARKSSRFSQVLNQAVFEGDIVCTMVRDDADIQQKYTLAAPQVTVDIYKETAGAGPDANTGIKHLTAGGGGVNLSMVKKAKEKMLGGVELKCHKFDYDAAEQTATAMGPGLIKADNASISRPKSNAGKFSLQRQCYAFARDFEVLNYYMKQNKVVADAKSHSILIDYIPVVKGQYGEQVSVTAGHIEANLVETASRQAELSTFTAAEGITYEEQNIQFIGSRLFYDAKKSLITAKGSRTQPCLLNGALVDGLRYDLNSGRINAEIKGAGAITR